MVRFVVEGDGVREKLQQLAAKEGIKPSRSALVRKERKEQAELAEQEAD